MRPGPLIRLLKLLVPFTWQMLLSVLVGFATVGSSIGLMATSAYIISKAALHPSIAELQVAIVGVRFFGLSRGLCRYLERYISHQVTFQLLARLRLWFYAALEPLAPARLWQYRSGDLLSRIMADIDTLEHVYVRVLAPPAVAGLIALLMAVLLAAFNVWLAVVALLFLALAGLGVSLLAWLLSRGIGPQLVALRAELNVALVDALQGAADLLACGQEKRQLAKIQALSRDLIRRQEGMAWLAGLHSALSGLLVYLAILAVLLVAIPLVASGRLDGIYLAVVVLAVIAAFEAVLPLPAAAQYLESSTAAASRLFEIIDARPEITSQGSIPRHLHLHAQVQVYGLRPTRDADLQHGLRPARDADLAPAASYDLVVENLHFQYGPAEPPALAEVTFHLPQGGRLAIVGPSGAGKSTLLYLLLRFWEYHQGRIILGGQELRDYAPEAARALFGVVSQQTHLFNATIRENLLLARPEAAEMELNQAVRQAHLYDFIQALPQGYDTWVGEQGLRLSGGERQRLAIARALLKNAPLLLLDEATANLDPLVEQAIYQELLTLMAGRSTLLITHRLVNLDTFDHILVLQGGRVVEQGRHADLLQAGGLYRRMWDLQEARW